MFVAFSRTMTVLMGAVVAFGLLLPIALRDHRLWLAVVIALCYAAYLAVNVTIWLRTQRRT